MFIRATVLSRSPFLWGIAILTGAIAERFLASQVEEVVEEVTDAGATEAELLEELRRIRSRLERLETR